MHGGYQGHFESVGMARDEIQEFQNHIAMVAAKREQVVGVIIHAVGEQPGTESGRNAVEMMAAIQDKLDEIVGMCENAKAELAGYMGGF
jgi:hypothetical protein